MMDQIQGENLVNNQKSHRSVPVWLGIFLFGFYMLFSGGHLYVKDGGAMYFMSKSLVEHGWFDVPQNPNTGGGKYGPDGRYYMPFGILQPLLATPFYIFGKLMSNWAGANYIPSMTITWFNCLITALLFALLCRFFIDLDCTPGQSLLLALAAAFSTPYWVYSRTFFSEPLAALGTLAIAWQIFAYSKNGRLLRLCYGGLGACAIILVRPLSGVVFPAIFLYLVLVEERRNRLNKTEISLKPFVIMGLMLGIGVLAGLLYNQVRFGGIFETGYDYLPDGRLRNFTRDPLSGLTILLFSPGKSIFLYAPLTLAAVIGAVIWIRRADRRAEGILSLGVLIMFLAVLCRWGEVEGGVTWGPRLIAPSFPVLLLALAPLFSTGRRWGKMLIVALFFVGFAVQSMGICINFSTYIHRNINSYFNPLNGSYLFSFNPFPGHWQDLKEAVHAIQNFEPSPEEISKIHRSFEQINYAEDLDFWWIHSYRDGINGSFIIFNLILQFFISLIGFAGIILCFRKT